SPASSTPAAKQTLQLSDTLPKLATPANPNPMSKSFSHDIAFPIVNQESARMPSLAHPGASSPPEDCKNQPQPSPIANLSWPSQQNSHLKNQQLNSATFLDPGPLVWPSNLVDVVMEILRQPNLTLNKPLFRFHLSPEAAEENFAIMESAHFNLDSII
ncbi:hypothetical protein ACHAXS_001142, partial [Conticribra weissflogii]